MRTRILFLLVIPVAAQCAEKQSAASDNIATGKKLFAASCSVGYCHGAEGRAGRGPRLRDREWDRNYLFKVIDEGIPNSSMPGWHAKYSRDQINSIIAYIVSISKEVTATSAEPARAAANPGPKHDSSVVNERPERDSVAGNAAAGKELFFDATNDRNCGVCHGTAGGGIGPEIAKIAAPAPREILRQILLPRSGNAKSVEIVTKDGDTLLGFVAGETGSGVRVFDLAAPGPPVLRTLEPSQIARRRSAAANLAHGSVADTYTIRQLLDIIAYLKSTVGSGTVQLQELF